MINVINFYSAREQYCYVPIILKNLRKFEKPKVYLTAIMIVELKYE